MKGPEGEQKMINGGVSCAGVRLIKDNQVVIYPDALVVAKHIGLTLVGTPAHTSHMTDLLIAKTPHVTAGALSE